MLAMSPPADSSAVMARAFSNEGKRAAKASTTAQGEGNMSAGTWKIHRISSHRATSAANTANAFNAVMRRAFTGEASLATSGPRARQWHQIRVSHGAPKFAARAD